MKKKLCTKCHINKSLICFTKDKTKKDGLYPSCKGCYRILKGSLKVVPKKRIVKGIAFYRCSKCKKSKTSNFYYSNPSNKSGLHNECKQCSINRAKSEVQKNKQKGRWQVDRLQALLYYSNNTLQCSCCGESHIEFLCLDHIDGNGKQHRKLIGNGHMYRWLKRNGYPKGLRVLCHNCNMSLGFYQYCPHHEKNT